MNCSTVSPACRMIEASVPRFRFLLVRDRYAAVLPLHDVVSARGVVNFETGAFECRDRLLRFHLREAFCHAGTVTRILCLS